MCEPHTFLEAAEAILGPRGLIRDAGQIAPWLTDWRGRYTGAALALAAPADTAQLSALLTLCSAHGVLVVPQGGNSGMSGGATPDDSGTALLLSLRRFDTLGEVDRDGASITCGAGVILQTLHDAAEAADMRFPLTLGGKGSATIGGLIATNAGGTQVLRHGTMRAQVLGVEAVLADGSVLNRLTPLKKDNRGFDLTQLLIGSEGTLGIITAATLRLVPAIAARTVMWAGLGSVHDARRLLLHAQASVGDVLEGFEILPAHSLDAVLDYLPDARAPLTGMHKWHALIELAGDADQADALPDRAQALLETAFEAGLIADATIAASDSQAEAFWLLRDSISPAERAIGPAMQHDISVPVARMADFIAEATAAVEALEVEGSLGRNRAIAFGHLGDGNVHFHVLAPPGTPASWMDDKGKKISAFVHDIVTRYEGSISAEHGIGQMKVDELERLGDPVSLDIMRRVKVALDPTGILNPGKLLVAEPNR
ncbi:MAG: FAD-binding oxidoreductase [Parerythrobacter sp.]